MSYKESVATMIGSVLFILGIGLAASFVGRGIRDPVAQYVLGEYSLIVMIAGIVSGFFVTVIGLGIGLGYGNMEEYHDGWD